MARTQNFQRIADAVARSVIISVILLGMIGLLHYAFVGPINYEALTR